MSNRPDFVVSELETEHQYIEAFTAWIDDFDAVDDSDLLLKKLLNSSVPLPAEVFTSLDLPAGSTYAEGAQLFLDRWKK
jgi:hypothetical protein